MELPVCDKIVRVFCVVPEINEIVQYIISLTLCNNSPAVRIGNRMERSKPCNYFFHPVHILDDP